MRNLLNKSSKLSLKYKQGLFALLLVLIYACTALHANDVNKVMKKLRDPSKRAEGMREFREIGSEALPEISKYAFDEREKVQIRAVAIAKLGALKAKNHKEELESCLSKDKDSLCRVAAANALASIGDASSIPALKKSMETDADGTVQMYSALALAKMGDRSVKKNAMKMLSSEDVSGQRAAVKVLEQVNDKEAIPELKYNLNRSTDPWTQFHNKQALYSIEMRDLGPHEKLQYLKTLLYVMDAYLMQKWIAQKIFEIGTPDAHAFLLSAANDENCPARYAAAKISRKISR